MIFELVDRDFSEKSKGSLYVRVNYNGDYVNWCHLKVNLSGKWDCDIVEFNKVMDSILVKDVKKACFDEADASNSQSIKKIFKEEIAKNAKKIRIPAPQSFAIKRKLKAHPQENLSRKLGNNKIEKKSSAWSKSRR